MSIRSAAWIAWSLCALCVALATASQILALLNGRTLGEIFITFAILTVSFSVVGALIISHRPENSIGWIFLAVGFCYGLLSAGDEYAIYALLTNPGALPWGAEASWLGQWIWAPGLGLILVFLPLLFPDGHPPSYRWRWVAWLGGLSIGLAVVSSTIGLWPERGPALVTGDKNPSQVVNVLVSFIALPMMLLAGLGAVISLLVRFRRARGDEQQQIKWFAFAAALTFVWILVIEVFAELLSIEGGVPEAILTFTWASAGLVIPSIPIATGIAILRYRLYDIDRIINRTLVYSALTATLVALYFGGVVVLQRVFVLLTGQQSTLAVVASTLLIAALFTPLRRRIQGFIDRRFYRRKYDARKTLEAFSATLRDETDLDALNKDLVGVVRETVLPLQAEKLTRTHAGVNSQHVQSLELVSFCSLKEPLYLLLTQGSYLLLGNLGRVDILSYVPGEQGPLHRLLEGLVQGGMDYPYCSRRKATVQLGTIEGLDLQGVYPVKPDAPKRWLEV